MHINPTDASPHQLVSVNERQHFMMLDDGDAGETGQQLYGTRDTRLGRDLAIKVLPPAFTADPDRLARFEQEARAAAARGCAVCLQVDVCRA